ncbi:MAG: SusC/RagA family TonB-linked outer membrane protein [Bacteroidales bacterium]
MKQKTYKEKWLSRAVKRALTVFCGLLMVAATFGQEKTITGTITDKNGETLPGVNVVIKGTSTGTVTDLNGKFSIKVPGPETVLVFSYVGYASQEVKVGDLTSINVTMTEEVRELDQVVVIGYGVQKKSDLTGAVASVSGSSFQGIATTNLNQALQGRAAGVNVVSNTGMPGGTVTIQIRGMSSVNGGSPLVVIDGIPGGDLNSLNPSDIESVEVLKDAASQAIYGSNGGNGVIIVTTKKGKEGKYQTTFNASYGWQNVAKTIPMMNLTDYNRVMGELKVWNYFRTNLDTLQYYDYNDLIFEDNVPMQQYDFSTGGGTDKSNFYVSGGYLNQDGIIRKSTYEKLNFRIKSEHKLSEKIRFDQNVNFVNTKREGLDEWMYTNIYFTPVYPALTYVPYIPPYKNGKWNGDSVTLTHPFVILDNRNYWNKDLTVSGNAGLSIELIKGLTYSTRMNGAVGLNDWQNFEPKYYFKANQNNSIASLEKSMQRRFGWVAQNVLNYNFNIAQHNFNLMAGQEARRDWGYDIRGMRQNFKSTLPNMLYFNKSLDDTTDAQTVRGGGYESRLSSYFARIGYNWRDIVLLQGNWRRDGQTHFGPQNRFGNFFSGSGGLKFSEFEVIKDLNLISFGKLRASYGETGTFPRSNWPYLAKIVTPNNVYNYSFDNNASSIGAGPVQIPNPDIHWETVRSINIGVDLGFWRDRLLVNIDWFEKKNIGMLNYQDVTYIAGTFQTQSSGEGGNTQPEVNFGSVRNRGIELGLSYKQTFGDLRLQADASLTYVKNKITELATDSVVKGSVHNEISGITILKVGQPIGSFWGYQVENIIKKDDPMAYYAKSKKDVYFQINSVGDTIWLPTAKPGDVRWKDLNNDGKITDADRTYLGDPNPPFIYSFSLNLTYKQFDMQAYFNGVAGNKIFFGAGRFLYDWNTIPSNRMADFANRYRDPLVDRNGNLILDNHGNPIDPGNESYAMPRMGAQNYARSSNLYIQDGTYLRLKNLQIGYTLPTAVSKALKIEKFRIYASLTNVFTLTKYKGFDPEVGQYGEDPSVRGVDIGGYPQSRVFSVGANLVF